MNVLYPKWKEALVQAGSNSALTGTVKAYLVDTSLYTYSSSHQFLSDVPSGARVGTAQTLASKTYLNGYFDAADLLYPAVTGPQVEALVLVVDTGSDATSRLVGYIDDAEGLPFSPVGLDQPVVWNSAGIFAL